jgi:hypothetical protein
MKNYVVTLIDPDTGRMQKIRVQSECTCDMQEFVNTLTDLELANPVVVDIDEYTASRLPLVDPT